MVDDSNQNLIHRLTLKASFVMVIVIITGTITRPFFSDLDIIFTLIGIFNSVMALILFFFIRANKHPKWEVSALLAVMIIAAFPLMAVSGGVNSQFAYCLPVVPMVTALLGNKTESLVSGTLLVLTVILGTYFGQDIADFTDDVYYENKSISRGFWLAMALMINTYLGIFIQEKNSELTKRLEIQASHDALTGILNRRGFDSYFSKEIEKARRQNLSLSIVMVDIDFFKKINDVYGHDSGDVVLKSFANCLQSNIRSSDVIGRFGGEEFIILLPGTSLNAAVTLAEKLRVAVSSKKYTEAELELTGTFGIATLTDQDKTTLDIIKRADMALYNGKENGRNRVETIEI